VVSVDAVLCVIGDLDFIEVLFGIVFLMIGLWVDNGLAFDSDLFILDTGVRVEREDLGLVSEGEETLDIDDVVLDNGLVRVGEETLDIDEVVLDIGLVKVGESIFELEEFFERVEGDFIFDVVVGVVVFITEECEVEVVVVVVVVVVGLFKRLVLGEDLVLL